MLDVVVCCRVVLWIVERTLSKLTADGKWKLITNIARGDPIRLNACAGDSHRVVREQGGGLCT